MGDPKGLTDEGPNFIGPLMIIVMILVFILLILGLFMPDTSWSM
jgi:hypothetical protein